MSRYMIVQDPSWMKTETYDSGAVVHYMLDIDSPRPETPAECGLHDVHIVGLDTEDTIDTDTLDLRFAWTHFVYSSHVDDQDAALIRWAAIFHDAKVTIRRGDGYSQGDQWTLAIVQNPGDSNDFVGWADEWINWARGDVYWMEVEIPDGTTDSLSGLYGDPDDYSPAGTPAQCQWSELGALVSTEYA